LPITGGTTNVVEGTEAGKKKLDVWLPVGHRATDPADVSGELHLVVEFIPVSVCFSPTPDSSRSRIAFFYLLLSAEFRRATQQSGKR
jgi:hypothetical protein